MIDEVLDLPIPHRVNKNIIDYLGERAWYFVNDVHKTYKRPFSNFVYDNSMKDAGQAINTYDKYNPHQSDITLNMFGDYVFPLIQERSKFKVQDIKRLYWNVYTPQSICQFHVDDGNVGKFVSAVYNLHTNDGGTQVGEEIAPAIESQAIIFRSEKIHKGLASKTSNFRLNLNIIMEL
jgi:hypothetical protein